MKDRINDMLKQADLMAKQIALTKSMYEIQRQITDITHDSIGMTKDMSVAVDELRDHIADFDDFFRPIRNYLYWEPHCFDIPVCWAMRQYFDATRQRRFADRQNAGTREHLDRLDVLLPQLLEQLPR